MIMNGRKWHHDYTHDFDGDVVDLNDINGHKVVDYNNPREFTEFTPLSDASSYKLRIDYKRNKLCIEDKLGRSPVRVVEIDGNLIKKLIYIYNNKAGSDGAPLGSNDVDILLGQFMENKVPVEN